MDVQQRGEVDFDEFKAGMKLAGMQFSEAEAREIFDTADLDGGGTIDYEEFSEVMREKLDDDGGGAQGDDSVKLRGLEGYWEKEQQDQQQQRQRRRREGVGSGPSAATRVLMKGECVGGVALDITAAAMEAGGGSGGRPFICSIGPFVSLVHALVHSLVYSLVYSLVHSLVLWSIRWSTHRTGYGPPHLDSKHCFKGASDSPTPMYVLTV